MLDLPPVTPTVFQQESNGAWYAVWSGYSLGPFTTKEAAEEEWWICYKNPPAIGVPCNE